MNCRSSIVAILILVLGCSPTVLPVAAVECAPGHTTSGDRCIVDESYFEGGWFTMGAGECYPLSQHDEELASGACEVADHPHEVFVPPFYIDATKVTVYESPGWTSCTGEGCPDQWEAWVIDDFDGSGDRLERAQEHCLRVGKTLPTESQWEFAASGAGVRKYPWGDTQPTCENVGIDADTCGPLDITVGIYPPTSEGLYDMAGPLGEVVQPDVSGYTEGYPQLPIEKKCPGYCENADSICTCSYDGLRGGPGAGRFRAAGRASTEKTGLSTFRCVRSP